MSETKWRECDDPEVLAAAVAAGVEVQVEVPPEGEGWRPSAQTTASGYLDGMSYGHRYRIPAGWSPEPPVAVTVARLADLHGRGLITVEEYEGRVAVLAAATPPPADDPRERIARAMWEAEDDSCSWDRVDACNWDAYHRMADAVLAVLPPSPVPPWPGAVLSGLTDEDGQPTWLAQAGQVRGEQVRARTDRGWDDCDGYIATTWVEVRAPRPAAATERVQAWEAVRDGRQVVGASAPFEAHYIWRSGPNRVFVGERTMDKAVALAPDGTVEVLKDGGR